MDGVYTDTAALQLSHHPVVNKTGSALISDLCCSGKEISITYSKCLAVALGIQYAK
jgi:hypothetical protein